MWHHSRKPLNYQPPGPEACDPRYLHDYRANMFARNFILSTKSTLVGGRFFLCSESPAFRTEGQLRSSYGLTGFCLQPGIIRQHLLRSHASCKATSQRGQLSRRPSVLLDGCIDRNVRVCSKHWSSPGLPRREGEALHDGAIAKRIGL